MAARKFQENNQGFQCVQCGVDVPTHPTSSRDHCTDCLYSLHVDIFPGDRANPCRGVLQPVGISQSNGKQQIVYKCEKCGEIEKNIVAPDDDIDRLVEVSVQL